MLKLYRSVLAAGAVAFGLTACGDDVTVQNPPEPTPAVNSVTVAPASVNMTVGQSVTFAASVNADAGLATTVTWSSSDASIATVDGTGKVTAVAAGTTTIVATSTADAGKKGLATVTVQAPVPGLTSFSVTPTNASIAVGAVLQASAQAVTLPGQTATITWATSNASVATVSASGSITGVAAGTAVITATATVGSSSLSATVGVTVTALPPAISSFTVTPSNATIKPAEVLQAAAVVTTRQGVAVPAVTWSTSNAAVATVSASGSITGVAAGTAVITASASAAGEPAVTRTIGVTVRELVAATVSINSVNAGSNAIAPNTPGLPVNLNNVNRQIDVNVNFDPGEQTVTQLDVLIGNKVAGTQSFATNPSAGILGVSINTADFVWDSPVAGQTTVNYPNGPTTLTARISVVGVGNVTATNTYNIVLNNVDGWAAKMTAPARSAQTNGLGNPNFAAGQATFWGGPGASGTTTTTLYPVTYSTNRNVLTGLANVVWGVGTVFNSCTASQPTGTQVIGYGDVSVTFNCAGYESINNRRDNVIVSSAVDNLGNLYPTALIPNVVVAGATPDSLRFDWTAPTVSTPSIARTAPAVTGWVNASFNFINFSLADGGVGADATTRVAQWSSINCPGVVASNAAMSTGTGADINAGVACPTNFIGGTPGLGSPGTAPWRVRGQAADLLSNVGVSSLTPTFGTDYTAPSIRWGLADAGIPLLAAVNQAASDTIFTTAKPTTQTFRAEAIDERSGFWVPSAESHMLSTASHANPTGLCLIGTGGPGATFVTAATCGLVSTPSNATVRLDGWRAGADVPVPTAEGYYGYRAMYTDAAGNPSSAIFRRLLVNTNAPFATGLGIPAILTSTNFNFLATYADSAEVINQSLQLTYPLVPGASDSLRYPQSAIGAKFDDAITSPFGGNNAPPTGAPYARGIEVVTGAAFPGGNVGAYPASGTKPTKVQAWSFNPSNVFFAASAEIAIPSLNVENGTGVAAWNALNPTNAVVHFRVIATVATTNQFGSTTPLRAQVVAPTNSPNAPFTRVDFYRLDAGGTWYNYLGSVAGGSAVGTDQGGYRSWVYALPNASFLKQWNGATNASVASGNVIIAVGVVSNGDAISTAATTMTP